jgi:phosphoribosylglycinamide formyltransferase-1
METPIHHTRLVVLVSGNGSNLQSILDACSDGRIAAEVVAVVSNRTDAFALERADVAGIPSVTVTARAGEPRAEYDSRLADIVAGFAPDHVVLAGWMRILTMAFLGWFPSRVINLHPALPGELAGTNAIERAWQEARAGARDTSGVMIHLVPDEGVDDRPVLATRRVPVSSDESLDEFAARMHQTEHELLVEVLAERCRQQPTRSDPQPAEATA